jgi:serine/threonine protein kinase
MKLENSFTRKLRENRQTFMRKQNIMKSGNRGGSNQSTISSYFNDFSTSNCSDINAYHFGRQIGHGAYAVVKEGVHKQSGERIAIKVYDRSKLVDPQRKKQAVREIKILSRLNHPNIARLFEAIDS